VKPWLGPADALTALRLPLAAVFPLMEHGGWRLAIVGAAAVSDYVDGILARRTGGSRVGVVLDPVADKLFMLVAFLTVAREGVLAPVELVAVLLRDVVAALAFLGTVVLGRPVALPARAGGKAVTVGQLLALVACIAGSPLARPLAWATGAIALYAIWDYGRAATRKPSGRVAWLGLLLATAAPAQEFQPPAAGGARGGTRIGLFGFGVRAGFELSDQSQMVFGATLDAGQLWTDRFRLRPSGEIGVFNGPNTFVGSLEALYRFTDDVAVFIPYAGAGFSVAGRDDCSTDPDCPDLWVNVVLGAELHFRSTHSWLLEYHAMDAFARHRLYVWLTTRRGN